MEKVRGNRAKALKVKVINKAGEVEAVFSSIHKLRKHLKIKNKVCQDQLKELRSGKVVKFSNNYICLADKSHAKSLKCKIDKEERMFKQTLSNKGLIRSENLTRSIQEVKESIVVLDGLLNVIGIHNETINDVSKKYKVPIGTIKASISKTKNMMYKYRAEKPNANRSASDGLYFLRAIDLIRKKQ